jgi:hypothetical protein
MSLKLSFNICQSSDCNSLVFREITGNYSCNSLGYGDTNPEPSQATSAILTITNHLDQELTVNLLDQDFPTNNTSKEFIINSTENFFIKDGFYIFEYAVIIDNVEYVAKRYKLLHCRVDCCLDKMKAKIAERSCRKSPEIENLLLADTLLESAKLATKCNNPIRAMKLLSAVEKICSINSCGC